MRWMIALSALVCSVSAQAAALSVSTTLTRAAWPACNAPICPPQIAFAETGELTLGDTQFQLGNYQMNVNYNHVGNIFGFEGSYTEDRYRYDLAFTDDYLQLRIWDLQPPSGNGYKAFFFNFPNTPVNLTLGGVALSVAPDPQAWMLLILGFAVIGAGMRKSSRQMALRT